MTLPTTRAGELPAEVEGWRMNTGCCWRDAETGKGSVTFGKGDTDVHFDAEYLEAQQTVSGYDGYSARICLPLPLLRALLAHHGLHIVGAEEMQAAAVGVLNYGTETMQAAASEIARLRSDLARAQERIAELERATNNECSLRVQATDAALALQCERDEANRAIAKVREELAAHDARLKQRWHGAVSMGMAIDRIRALLEPEEG